jgi:hypothetical protein
VTKAEYFRAKAVECDKLVDKATDPDASPPCWPRSKALEQGHGANLSGAFIFLSRRLDSLGFASY